MTPTHYVSSPGPGLGRTPGTLRRAVTLAKTSPSMAPTHYVSLAMLEAIYIGASEVTTDDW
jgi:hypothetical protein